MLICSTCKPDHELVEGDTLVFCVEHAPESPRPAESRPQQEAPTEDRVQGRFLFDLPSQSVH